MSSLIVSRDCALEVFRLHSEETGKPVFVRSARLPGASRLRCFDGCLVGYAVLNEVSIPCLTNWRTGTTIKLHDLPDRAVSRVLLVGV